MAEVPEDLGEAGRALFSQVVDEFDLELPELVMLAETARTLDELVTIRNELASSKPIVTGSTGQPKVNPLFAEARAHRLLLAKLLGELALPAEEEEKGRTPAQKQAAEAANVRWALERERWGRRGTA
ncbi:hypothetical protein [Microbispora sp. GKU 823]|uniref:hypothetical protein n=1 Tax=Microbispora sp. GKU 823 TaxID=1652100 RepID=UPI00117EA6AB|nr:hypothetical protein [Microbispora sp. GKU 823]